MVQSKPKLKNILIVDDDDEYNFITEDIFQDTDLNCNLIFKLWAMDALDYLEENKGNFPDLILLDINMPIMNGWEFLEAYESRKYHITEPTIIIMNSSSVYQEDKEKAKTYTKVVDYIDKPVTVKNIYRIRDTYFGL